MLHTFIALSIFGAAPPAGTPVLVGVTNKNLFLSQHNWAINTTAKPEEAVTPNSGRDILDNFPHKTSAFFTLRGRNTAP